MCGGSRGYDTMPECVATPVLLTRCVGAVALPGHISSLA